MITTWTPEREATLRRMWGEGRSASEIARELGGVNRNAVIGKIHRLGLSREREPKKENRVCAFPGCGVGLYPDAVSGLCKMHTHARGLCRCQGCTDVPPEPRIADRADVRVTEVPYPTSNSGVALKARVSLKREPWLNT